jgi:hypothetical protein
MSRCEQAHLCRRWLCGREDGARRVAHRDVEAGDCEATQCHGFRDLVQKMDRRKDIRLDQPQSSPSPRFRTLRHNSCRVRPLGHDPHHAKAACCRKLLVMNPNFPDGLIDTATQNDHPIADVPGLLPIFASCTVTNNSAPALAIVACELRNGTPSEPGADEPTSMPFAPTAENQDGANGICKGCGSQAHAGWRTEKPLTNHFLS